MIYNLVQILENSAKEFPTKPAFKYLDESISYSDLNIKTNQLAQYLKRSGVKKGDRVGVLMHRCLETSIAVYGVLKSGAAYVPIDPFVPIERIRFLIQDCGIEHLVCTNKQSKKIKKLLQEPTNLVSIVGATGFEGITTKDWEDVFSQSITSYVPTNIVADDLSYILYTSGSTGTPKGIMHTHASSLAFAQLVEDLYGFRATDIIANSAPLHFDVSTLGFFSAPLAGCTTVIISDAHLKFPASLADITVKEKVTVWYSVPLLLIELLHKGGIEAKDFSNLRWVLFAGEVFPTKQLRALMEQWPFAEFGNIYGPTETNQCTYYNLSAPPKTDDPIPIGYTWGNTEYKILDENDAEVETGQEGLLIIRSATMMKGYWNNVALTEASLYKEVIAPGFEHIYYRTGDLVRLNENGELLFLGRKDRQIKFRGFRIEVDEIESTLAKHPAVIEVAVILIKDADEIKEIVGSVLIADGLDLEPDELKQHCRALLPVYAVPERIFILKDFPRTSSGKINRKEIEHKINAL